MEIGYTSTRTAMAFGTRGLGQGRWLDASTTRGIEDSFSTMDEARLYLVLHDVLCELTEASSARGGVFVRRDRALAFDVSVEDDLITQACAQKLPKRGRLVEHWLKSCKKGLSEVRAGRPVGRTGGGVLRWQVKVSMFSGSLGLFNLLLPPLCPVDPKLQGSSVLDCV